MKLQFAAKLGAATVLFASAIALVGCNVWTADTSLGSYVIVQEVTPGTVTWTGTAVEDASGSVTGYTWTSSLEPAKVKLTLAPKSAPVVFDEIFVSNDKAALASDNPVGSVPTNATLGKEYGIEEYTLSLSPIADVDTHTKHNPTINASASAATEFYYAKMWGLNTLGNTIITPILSYPINYVYETE